MEQPFEHDASYICDGCGQDIVIPLDISAGHDQQYVEDCPICCRPNVIRVTLDPQGNVSVSSSAEQDRY